MKLTEKIAAITILLLWIGSILLYIAFWGAILWMLYKLFMWILTGGLG